MKIRPANPSDFDAVWQIFKLVIQNGDTFVFKPETKKDIFEAYWFCSSCKVFVVEEEGKVHGSYFIKPNQPDRGSHIANCSYIIHPEFQGKGMGRKLCEHSIGVASKEGYKALQFNFVVSTNMGAIKIWKENNFRIIGRIPEGFKHKNLGFVDVFIMYRDLKNNVGSKD